MPFNVGDVVRIKNNNALRSGTARVQRVLPRTMSVQDFQEYVVEFINCGSETFRFGLCREFAMKRDADKDDDPSSSNLSSTELWHLREMTPFARARLGSHTSHPSRASRHRSP